MAVVSAVKIPDPHPGSESIHDWVVGTLIDPSRLHHSVPRSGAFRQSKSFQLVRPLSRCVAQTGLADATGQAAFDCRLDKIRRNERHRDRHVDITNAALVVCAICSIPAAAPVTNSSSQARPRAIDLIRPALRSGLIGRVWCLDTLAGSRISRDFFDGGLRHGILR